MIIAAAFQIGWEGGGLLQLFLEPSAGTGVLFSVRSADGVLMYEATGEFTPLGRKFIIADTEGREISRISGMRLTSACQYSVSAGKEHMRITTDFSSPHRCVRLRGIPWRFRGSALSRSFDLVNAQSRVVMTHGRCWTMRGECYAMEIPELSHIPLCLSVAVVIDSIAACGRSAPVPV